MVNNFVWNTVDWMFDSIRFSELNSAYGPFEVDACCNLNGSNALLPKFWSNALQQNWQGLHVWCTCPFHMLQKFIKHAVKEVYASPENTKCTMVIPY